MLIRIRTWVPRVSRRQQLFWKHWPPDTPACFLHRLLKLNTLTFLKTMLLLACPSKTTRILNGDKQNGRLQLLLVYFAPANHNFIMVPENHLNHVFKLCAYNIMGKTEA